MTLKRQLLLVSLLALMLPWAGCEFIRQTESALRSSHQQILASTATAIADSMAQYAEEFPIVGDSEHLAGYQLYGHALAQRPSIDGYLDDWAIDEIEPGSLEGPHGRTRYVIGLYEQHLYLYVAVTDPAVVYATPAALIPDDGTVHADRVQLISANPPYLEETLSFAAEAPGPFVAYVRTPNGFTPEPTIRAFWQDVADGYRIEARIPLSQLGTHLGLVVRHTDDPASAGVRSSSFRTRSPGAFVSQSPGLTQISEGLVQPGMRMIVTDAAGWRIAIAGDLAPPVATGSGDDSSWLRVAYGSLVEPGAPAALAEPDPSGREQRAYIASALQGRPAGDWFRSDETGRAIVASAEPVRSGDRVIGAVVLQWGTDEVLSLTNEGLARLLNVTLIAMLIVAAGLLGYATWLSRRIRSLSAAAEYALENDMLRGPLPSAGAADELGDLSRSFSHVLTQLGDYNEYLRTLASKLSHELRTPLAIVTSSLDNLEHENLDEASAGYTSRARDGAERLRRILAAMSEASRVEELMKNADPETFDLKAVLDSTITAYRDAYPERNFEFDATSADATLMGSPELIIQMLDKLVDNAVGFSEQGATIEVTLESTPTHLRLDVGNPGPPLPERMRKQLFDSLVSVRGKRGDRHLGLGLYIAKLIVDGHNGRIEADNTDDGVRFSVYLPADDR